MTTRTYSESDRVAQAVKTRIDADSVLSGYVSEVYTFADEIEMEDAGKFPFVNVDIRDVRVEELPGIPNLKGGERRVYPVLIMFSTRNKIKSVCKRGDDTTYGILDMFEHIRDCIYADRTFGGVTNGVALRPEFSCDVTKHLAGEYWIGRAVMMFETCIDELF